MVAAAEYCGLGSWLSAVVGSELGLRVAFDSSNFVFVAE